MNPTLKLFRLFFIDVTVFDLLDICLIAFILYKLYYFIRGSRAAQMAVGLFLILIVSTLAQLFDMSAMSWLFRNLKTVWLISFVILFQPELRRMLVSLGQSRFARYFMKVSQPKALDELLKGIADLVRLGYGALIVVTGKTGLKTVIETGVRLQAEVSAPLLISLFNPKSPLHDGAIVIQGEIIEAAKCILPLSHETWMDMALGTRHRAGLGISEESDAFVIIVSEERRSISVALAGKLMRDVSIEQLRSLLKDRLVVTSIEEE